MNKRIILLSCLFVVVAVAAVLLAPSSRSQLLELLNCLYPGADSPPKSEVAQVGLPQVGLADIPGLLKAMQDQDVVARNKSVAALERIGKPAIPAIVAALGDNAGGVRQGAIRTLRDLPLEARQASQYFMASLKDEDRGVQEAARAALLGMGREAIPALSRGLKDPDPRVRYHCAVLLIKHGCAPQEAISAVAPAVTDGDAAVRAEALRCLGSFGAQAKAMIPKILAAMKDDDPEVRACADEARRRIDPTELERHILAIQGGNADESIDWFSKMLKAEPNNLGYRMQLGRAYAAKNDYLRAIEEYSEALRLNPDFLPALSARHDVYFYKLGDDVRAMADWKRIVAITPPNAKSYNNIAWSLATSPKAEIRDGKEAIKYATLACQLEEHPWYVDTLAAAHAEAGNFEEAVNWQMKALKNPEAFPGQALELAQSRLRLYQEGQPFRQN
jgi:tetratricopeptide (TPR) repeat protein